jgi:hypothetical protein
MTLRLVYYTIGKQSIFFYEFFLILSHNPYNLLPNAEKCSKIRQKIASSVYFSLSRPLKHSRIIIPNGVRMGFCFKSYHPEGSVGEKVAFCVSAGCLNRHIGFFR